MSVRIMIGDVRARLAELPDESVHCVVTSPPYFGLRDYGTASWEGGDPACDHAAAKIAIGNSPSNKSTLTTNNGKGPKAGDKFSAGSQHGFARECPCGATRTDRQIGLEDTPAAFVAVMVEVFREVKRVLRSDGVLFLNLGDSYFGGGRGGGSEGSKQRTNVGALIDPPKWSAVNGDARHATAYGMNDKAPAGSPSRDCFCQSLCGACRAAYRFGRSHSAPPLGSMPPVSSVSSSRERKVSPSDHLPMSDSVLPGARSLAATRDPRHSPSPATAQPLSSQESTLGVSGRQLLETRSRVESRDEGCRLCGRSLAACALPSSRTSADQDEPRSTSFSTSDQGMSTRDTASIDGASAGYMSDTASDCSCGDYTTTSRQTLKPKDLISIPWRVAFALQADGWYLRSEIIWYKPNPMPESVTDRPTKSHEQLFLLTKRPTYHYDAAAIAEPLTASSIERLSQPTLDQQAGSDRVPGKTNRSGVGEGLAMRNRRSVWTVATQPFSEAHFATFPPALIEPCILAGCPKDCCAKCGAPVVREVERTAMVIDRSDRTHELGRTRSSGTMLEPPKSETIGWSPTCTCNAVTARGVCLDPFGGAGTTGLVADRLSRDAILIELNPEYAAIAERRINADAGMFAKVAAE